MMKNPLRLIAVLTLGCPIGFAQQVVAPESAKSPQLAPGCDATLWKFVYHPSRLPAKNDCRVVTGTIKNFVAEADGDYHIRLIPDDKSLINQQNLKQEGGALVVEPICQSTPTQADAKKPCQGYNGPKFSMSAFCPGAPNHPAAPVEVPGQQNPTFVCKNPPRVQITGFYTIDNDHGWMEQHTVSSIKLLAGAK